MPPAWPPSSATSTGPRRTPAWPTPSPSSSATAGSRSRPGCRASASSPSALAVSRTTVTRAYAALRDAGYAEARQGSGTFTRVPGGRSRAHDRALLPRPGDEDAIDLNCAAASRSPGTRRGVRRGGGRAAGVPRRARLLPGRPAPAARPRSPRRTTSAACRRSPARSWSRRVRCSAAVGRRAGVHRPGRPGARRVPGLPERDAGDPAQRRPDRGLARSTPTAGTSTPPARPCARPRRSWPT